MAEAWCVCDRSRLFLALLGSRRYACPLSRHVQTALYTNRVRRRKHRGHLLPWNKDAERCVALVRKCGHYSDLKSVGLKRCNSFQTTHRWSRRWIQSQFCTSVASVKPKGKCSLLKGNNEKEIISKAFYFQRDIFWAPDGYYQELHKGSKWTISQTVFCKIVYLKHLLSYTSYY